MSEAPLTGIRACVFDAYGTLFDTASAAKCWADALDAETIARLAALWRDKQLQYTWLRTVESHHADFWQVTGEGLDFALASVGIADSELHGRLMEAYLALEAYPDAVADVRSVRDAGIATAILDHAGLAALFDPVLSIEEVGVFKPDPRVYQLACDRLGVAADAIAFVSSNGWDAWAASAFGMRVVWCNRQGLARERLPGAPDHEIRSLAELPALLAAPPEG